MAGGFSEGADTFSASASELYFQKMSEDNTQTSSADGSSTTIDNHRAPMDFVHVDVKIETNDSEQEDTFGPDSGFNDTDPAPGVKENGISATVQPELGGSTEADPPPPGLGKGLTCDRCDRVFTRASSLALHARAHDQNLTTYTCQRCQSSFPYKMNLMRHLSSCRAKPSQPPVSCPLCPRTFSSKTRMRTHMGTQHAAREHRCDVCGKRFKDDGAVARHRLRHTHSVPKRLSCSVCGKTFAILNALEVHMRIHTKERPFQCAVCVRAFSHKHNMLRHMLRHNKVLHLKCEVCHKEFPRESRLKYHMRVHWPDKKPYKCGQCHETYSHQQNITRHYRKKHPDVEYIPPTTDAEFANKAWKLRMERTDTEPGNREYILPEVQRCDSGGSDSEAPISPELVIVNNVKMEPELGLHQNKEFKVEPTMFCEIKQELV